jgi:hypothetical protein
MSRQIRSLSREGRDCTAHQKNPWSEVVASDQLMLVREVDGDIREGRGHQGVGAVVQLLGRKPIVGIPSGDLVG